MSVSDLSVGWFDVLVLAMLLIGFWRGRSRGMSEELLDLFQWLLIVVTCGLLYKPLGGFVVTVAGTSRLLSYVTAYVVVAIAIKALFTVLKRTVGDKLIGSDVFGNLEYYLGATSGMIRHVCMLILFMALLNAREFTAPERAHWNRIQRENFGSINLPTIVSIQDQVFKGSFAGRAAQRYLKDQMIEPTKASRASKRKGIGRNDEIQNIIEE